MAIPITDLMNATAEEATLREQERIIKLAQDKYNHLIETFGIAIVKDQLDLLLELMDAIKGEK